MFPVSDVIPSRRRPVATLALIAAIAIAFGGELLLDDRGLDALIRGWGVVPSSFEWYTAVTALFLHAGWLHAGANVLFLWLFGPNVEDRLGRLRFLLFHLAGGCAAAVAYIALSPNARAPMIGASGSVAAVMGAYVVLYPQSRVLTAVFAVVFFDLVEVPAVFYLGVWIFLQLFVDVWTIGASAPAGTAAFIPAMCAFVIGGVAGVYLRFGEQTLRSYWRMEGSRAKIKI